MVDDVAKTRVRQALFLVKSRRRSGTFLTHKTRKPDFRRAFRWRRRELKTAQAILREPTFIDFYGVGWKRRSRSKWRSTSQFDAPTQGAA